MGYPKAVARATRREAAQRRKSDLPPFLAFRAAEDQESGWGGSTPRSSWYKNARANLASSAYGSRASEAPPSDKAFNIRKPQKWTRTLPLMTATATEWTVSSWAIGSCAGTSPLNG